MYFVIPMGGRGERFQKAGFKEPKPLIPIINKPMLSYVLDEIVNHYDPDKDTIILIHDIPEVRTFVDSRYHQNIIHVPISRQTSGAAETILVSLQHIFTGNRSPVLCIDCDTFYSCWDDIIATIQRDAATNIIFYVEEKPVKETQPALFSYILFEEDSRIVSIAEKKRISKNANTGAYYFASANTFIRNCEEFVKEGVLFNGEYYISGVIDRMLNSENIHVFKAAQLPYESVISLGTPKQVADYVNNAYATLFDLDGTLVTSDHVYYQVWQRLLESHHIQLTTDVYDRYIKGNSDAFVCKTLGLDTTDISKSKDELFIEMIDQVDVVPGAIEYVKRCYKTGNKVCVVTNCNRRVAETLLKHFNLEKYLECIVIGAECKRPKPYPDPYETALNMLNMENTRAIIFEDSPSGIKSAESVFPLAICHIGSETYPDFLHISTCLNELCTKTSFYQRKIQTAVAQVLHTELDSILVHDTKLKGGYIADVIRVCNQASDTTCVVKMQSDDTNTALSKMAEKLDLYEREMYFYETISAHLPLQVLAPKCYGILRDPHNLKPFGVLLEDLDQSHMKNNLDLNTEPIDVSLRVIKSMAALHAHFWDKTTHFPRLKSNNNQQFNWSEFVQERWPAFKYKWSAALTQTQLEKGDTIATRFNNIQNELSQDPLTLCHGDIKSPNIFYDTSQEQAEPWFIDWQYIVSGKGVQDLVFFIIESFTEDNIHQYAQLFCEYYFVCVNQFLSKEGQSYTREQFTQDIHNAVHYFPFFVAVWFGTTPEEHLIDVNFPFFFITKYFSSIEKFESI